MTQFKHKKIAILAGGPSSESEVSHRSAKNVLDALTRQSIDACIIDVSEADFFDMQYDIAFNCVHGKWGEDGCLQGYLEMKGIPYTGPGVMATAIGFNKPIFKSMIASANIPVANSINKQSSMSFPFMAKPKSSGSSIGIHYVQSSDDWHRVKDLSPEVLGPDYFYEAYIEGVEITVGVLTKNNQPMVLPILEIQSKNEFYDYDGKYTPGKSELIIPANISKSVQQRMNQYALDIYSQFNCKGCIRIDAIIDRNDDPYILEMNTCPGLTNTSDIPKQASAAGISFDDLVMLYLQSAIH